MSYTFRGIAVDDGIKESIDRYVEHGVPTGGFLEACITNNLCAAVNLADERNLPQIPAIAAYFYNECPIPCWGSRGAYNFWLEFKREERRQLAGGTV